MAKYVFRSIFSSEINNYIADKSFAGYDGNNIRRSLISFDKFCFEQNIKEPIFTTSDASKWIQQKKSEAHTTHYSRINTSKQFLKYLSTKGYDVCIVRDIKYKGTDFLPPIYTEDEVNNYFLAVDRYSSARNRKDVIQYPVLFRILYCCGTRINETLGIRKKDIDLNKGTILLNKTKNDKQRCVVLGNDLIELIREYANKCFYLLNDDDFIFTNANGGRLNAKTVNLKHREFLRKAGIPFLGDGKGPRVHDWRHHFAVYSFKQMLDSGMDMYVALPILSTYLGHKTIYATEKYVRLTMQIFPYIEEKIHPVMDQIFGKQVKEGVLYENN